MGRDCAIVFGRRKSEELPRPDSSISGGGDDEGGVGVDDAANLEQLKLSAALEWNQHLHRPHDLRGPPIICTRPSRGMFFSSCGS